MTMRIKEIWSNGVLVSTEQYPEPVPDVVSARQLKRALLDAGMLDEIDAFVAQAPRAMRLDWEYATEFNRGHPVLLTAIGMLGMSDAQADALFVAAGQIE